HNSSSETRRRHELGHFVVTREFAFLPHGSLAGPGPGEADPPAGKVGPDGKPRQKTAREVIEEEARRRSVDWAGGSMLARVRRPSETKTWQQGSLEGERGLAAFGPLVAEDPGIQFCLQAARRNLGDFDTPRKWYADFVGRQPAGPWRDAAAAELWLASPQGPPPEPGAGLRPRG